MMAGLAAGALRLGAGVAGRLDLALAVGPAAAVRHRRLALREAELYPGRRAVVTAAWLQAAEQVGASASDLGDGRVAFERHGRRAEVRDHYLPLEDPAALRLALDRGRVDALLAEAGVPTPDHLLVPATRPRGALGWMRARPGPFVVKPASGTSGGHGITCEVRTAADFARAALSAGRFDDELLVETQAPGSMYRMLVLDGRLIGTVRRDPPALEGDGRSSVAELVAGENRRRLAAAGREAHALLRPDLDHLLTLRRQGLKPRSVPAAGRRVQAKTSSSENARRENHVIHAPLAPELERQVLAATAPLGLRLAGADVVTTHLDRGLDASGGAVVEVNGTPGLHYHYMVADPDAAVPVAVPILETLLKETQPT
jgi:D-alanine-D-alanine ligase-like ATP-grasp enzyme